MLREEGIIYYRGDDNHYKRPMKKSYFKKKIMHLEEMIDNIKHKDIRKEKIEYFKDGLKDLDKEIELISKYSCDDIESIKLLSDMKLSYQEQIELWKNKAEEEIMMERQKQISTLEKRIRELRRKEENNPSKRIKKCRKKISHDKLKEMILSYIDTINSDINYNVTKEEISQNFNVKESDVELIFMELNREGILSQRVPRYAHDTNRNPMFPMDISGWSSDIYKIRKKAER